MKHTLMQQNKNIHQIWGRQNFSKKKSARDRAEKNVQFYFSQLNFDESSVYQRLLKKIFTTSYLNVN